MRTDVKIIVWVLEKGGDVVEHENDYQCVILFVGMDFQF